MTRRRPWADFGLVVLVGGSATCGQILFVREVFVLCHGVELTLGLVLATHLLLTAAGGWTASRWIVDHPRAVGWAQALSLGAALLLPGTILALSLLRNWLGLLPAEYIPLTTLVPLVALLQTSFCFVVGMFFPVALSLLEPRAGQPDVAGVYVLESLGSGMAGLVFTLLLTPFLWPLQIACILGTSLALGGLVVGGVARVSLPSLILPGMAAAVLLYGAADPSLQVAARTAVWQRLEFVAGENSPMGFLEAVRLDGSISVYENGLLQGTTGESWHARRMVGLGDIQRTPVSKVLLVGGLANGYLDALFARPGRQVKFVESNPFLADFTVTHMGIPLAVPGPDGALSVFPGDERSALETSRETYDLVLVDAATPSSLYANRRTSIEFFQRVGGVLSPDGLLVFGIHTSPEIALMGEADLLVLLRRTLKSVFEEVLVFPGGPSIFLAGSSAAVAHVLDRYHSSRGDPASDRLFGRSQRRDPVGFFDSLLKSVPEDGRVNTDLAPLAYHLSLLGQVGIEVPTWGLLSRPGTGWKSGLMLSPILLLVVLLFLQARSRSAPLVERVALVVVGMTGMASHILILFAYQIRFGSLYSGIGLLITVCMLGLAAGAWCAGRRVRIPARTRPLLLIALGLMTLLPLVLRWILRLPDSSGIGFYVLSAVLGILVGALFIMLVSCLHAEPSSRTREQLARTAGRAYALDLAGASAGAVLVTPVVFPVLGMQGTSSWLMLLNACLLAAMLLLPRKSGGPSG